MDRRRMISNGLGLLVASGAAPGAGRTAAAAADGVKRRRIDLRIRFMTTRNGRTFERGRETVSYAFHDDGLIDPGRRGPGVSAWPSGRALQSLCVRRATPEPESFLTRP